MRVRYNQCPMCDDLVRLRVGDRVCVLLSDDGRAVGVDCTVCGGWRDDGAPALGNDLLELLRSASAGD